MDAPSLGVRSTGVCALPFVPQEHYVGVQGLAMEQAAGRQQRSNWCWAACVQMILKGYGVPADQQQIVQRLFGHPVDRPGGLAEILQALNGWGIDLNGRLAVVTAAAVTDPTTMITELASSRPLLVGLQGPSPNAPGHAYVLSGAYFCPTPQGLVLTRVVCAIHGLHPPVVSKCPAPSSWRASRWQSAWRCPMRPLSELIADDSGWPLVQSWLKEARVPVEVLPRHEATSHDCLLQLQVTARSPMGAIALHTAGIRYWNGWLRVLGGGLENQRGLADWNGLSDELRMPGAMLVADDALGGFFALNGGALPGPAGALCYLAPDTLRWEPLELTYSEFIQGVSLGAFSTFYEPFFFEGWQSEAATLAWDDAIHVHPPLWSSGPPLAERSRQAVPIVELWDLTREYQRQL